MKNFEQLLQEELDKLPYEKHVDGGRFELGARWALSLFKNSILQEDSPLKATFSTTDKKEMLRIIKSEDMAHFIWELNHNAWRQFKHTDYDWRKAWDAIRELMQEYEIDTDELTS